MVKNSQENIKIKEDLASEILGKYTLKFSVKKLKRLYELEKENFNKFVNAKAQDYVNDVEDMSQTIKNKIINAMKCEDYIMIYPTTIEYIESRVWRSVDGKYYVSMISEDGSFFPMEYNKAIFYDVHYRIFPLNIKKWFDIDDNVYSLTIDINKGRTFIINDEAYLNLFDGFKYNKTDVRDEDKLLRGLYGVNIVWNHIKEILCNNNEDYFNYVQNWIRKLINGHKMKTLLYFKSKMGRGKNVIINFLISILGSKICAELHNDHCFRTLFNGCLIGKSLVVLNEIVHNYDDFKSLYNTLKTYITEDRITYRSLYENPKLLKNLNSFILIGNYSMLKLDDPSKGDDRRIFFSVVSEVIKNFEYCRILDSSCLNEDVQYAFYCDCIDNYVHFNEQEELKLLPISETKIEHIQDSLDSVTLFLKSIVNNKKLMDTYIKPKYLFNIYEEYVNDKKKSFKYGNFNKIIDGYKSFINRVNKREEGREKTGYIIINKDLMIEEFTNKHYWCNYDDVVIEEIKEENKQEIKEEEESKKLMEEINKISDDMHKNVDDYLKNLNNNKKKK